MQPLSLASTQVLHQDNPAVPTSRKSRLKAQQSVPPPHGCQGLHPLCAVMCEKL